MASTNLIVAVIVLIVFIVSFILACIIGFTPASDVTNKTNSGLALLVFSLLGIGFAAYQVHSARSSASVVEGEVGEITHQASNTINNLKGSLSNLFSKSH
jgi:hypothetical protein